MSFLGNNSSHSGARDFLTSPLRTGKEPAKEAEERAASAASPVFPAPERPAAIEPPAAPTPRQGATPPEGCLNVIAKGSRWKGALTIDDSVRIEGQMSGEIMAKDTVHIAESAVVEAKVHAAYVVISGRFGGEVRCRERLELLPKSRVKGELFTKLLIAHEGAVIDGHIQMTTDEADSVRTTVGERTTTSSGEGKAVSAARQSTNGSDAAAKSTTPPTAGAQGPVDISKRQSSGQDPASA